MDNSYFGKYGGTFIPETLSFALEELENLYREIKDDRSFKAVSYTHLTLPTSVTV